MATEYPKKSADAARAAAQQAVDAAAERLNAKLQAKADKVVAKTTKKTEDKVAKATKKVDQAAAKVKDSIGATAVHHPHVHEGGDPFAIWMRHAHDGRRPRCTRDDIAAAAIRIADSEGLDAVSMRRLAAELDVGTMTLYHYIATKDELLTLVFDGMMREIALPPGTELPSDWRAAISTIARRSRDAMRRHPWILDISDDPPLGPNAVRHFDQSLQALSSLQLPLQTKVDILTSVDEYVFGFCLHERNNQGDAGRDLTPRMEDYLHSLVATGDYPALADLTAGRPMNEVWVEFSRAIRDDGRFERNLSRLLDGFEQSFPSRKR